MYFVKTNFKRIELWLIYNYLKLLRTNKIIKQSNLVCHTDEYPIIIRHLSGTSVHRIPMVTNAHHGCCHAEVTD